MKNPIRVVFSTGSAQPGHVGRAIAGNGILPLVGVVQVQVRVELADRLGGMCHPSHPLHRRSLDPRVIGRVRPFEAEENIDEWTISRVEAEGISACQVGSGGDGGWDGLESDNRSDTRDRKDVLEG